MKVPQHTVLHVRAEGEAAADAVAAVVGLVARDFDAAHPIRYNVAETVK